METIPHDELDAAFEAVLGRRMTDVERKAKRYEREAIERREVQHAHWKARLSDNERKRLGVAA